LLHEGENFLKAGVGERAVEGYLGFFATFQAEKLQGEALKRHGMKVLGLINQDLEEWQNKELGLRW
jgi:hypothetical protein